MRLNHELSKSNFLSSGRTPGKRAALYLLAATLLTASALVGAEQEGTENMLLPGPATAQVNPRPYTPLSRPYRPWKTDWENYIHKDFFPCISDYQISSRPADGRPPALAYGSGRPLGAARQAVQVLWQRCFDVPASQKQLLRTKPLTPPLAGDWRGYDLLRWDVKTSAPAHMWLAIEDQAVYPPVVGNYDIPADAWTTLELDLEQATQRRGLDLGKMWMLWARVSMDKGSVQWRNLRLAKRGAKADHPVLADARACDLPPHPAKQAPPTPNTMPDAARLDGPCTLVYKSETEIDLDFRGHTVSAQVAAFDAQRLLLVLTDKDKRFGWQTTAGKPVADSSRDELFAVQTLDGGKTWTGLDGDQDRSYMFTYMKPLTQVIDGIGNAILWNENGCDNNPGPRRRLTRLTFLGKQGWTYNRQDYVFDSESFHCGFQKRGEDTVRTASGRIWAVVHTEHRLIDPASALYAMYSDDDGRSWHSWQEGRIAMIPGTGDCTSARVIPYGREIAVFWQTPKGIEPEMHHYWSSFDGKEWTPPAVVDGRYMSSVAGIGPREFLLSARPYSGKLALPGGNNPGVKRFDGKDWSLELATPTPGSFCVSGRSVAAVSINARRDGFLVRWRSADGKWGAEPQAIPTGPVTYFRLPQFGPPDCVPILYMNKDDRHQAKILLVPNR